MLSVTHCNICPRQCGVNRLSEAGACGCTGDKIRVGRAMLHYWEEPCISGENGSGAVFFSGCPLKCIYCQNRPLSRNEAGQEISVSHLASVMLRLQEKGAHNINLVTPTHYAISIIEAVKQAKDMGLTVPIVYNTSGYECVQTIRALKDTVSVYLSDFKYFDDRLGRQYSGVPDYFEQTSAAVCEMVKQVGPPVFDENGLMQRGVLIRHLLLPGHMEDSKNVLKYLHDTFHEDILISIMNQFTPVCKTPFDNLNHKIDVKSYDEIIEFAVSLGIENGFIQEEGTQSESFIPSFNGEGLQ